MLKQTIHSITKKEEILMLNSDLLAKKDIGKSLEQELFIFYFSLRQQQANQSWLPSFSLFLDLLTVDPYKAFYMIS